MFRTLSTQTIQTIEEKFRKAIKDARKLHDTASKIGDSNSEASSKLWRQSYEDLARELHSLAEIAESQMSKL